MAAITTADVRAYVAQRLAERTIHRKAYVITRKDGSQHHIPACERSTGGTSHGQINRELTILKRAFTLACQAGKLLVRPYIPMLKESNTRTGFFEAQQLEGVIRHLPTALQPVIRFAYITGWRIDSEVLPIEWRNVDFAAGEVRLDPHVAKNDEGRVFPFTRELRTLLEAQHAEHERLQKAGQIVPLVFIGLVAKGRRGPKSPRKIKPFNKAWKTACEAAGCPGRIPHDLRRTDIRNLVRAGIPERVAMQLSGHETRSVFERYNIVSGSDLKAAARALDAARA